MQAATKAHVTPGAIGVVVGCGTISDEYLRNLTAFPDLRVLCCADLDLERANRQFCEAAGRTKNVAPSPKALAQPAPAWLQSACWRSCRMRSCRALAAPSS